MPPDSSDKTAMVPTSTLGRFSGWVARAGRLEIAVLLAILLGVSGLWGFGVLAAEVLENDTGKFDERLLLAMRQPGDRSIPIGPCKSRATCQRSGVPWASAL